MILIAENLNSSVPNVQEALEKGDDQWIVEMATALDESPADYLDLNAGQLHDRESEILSRLIDLVRSVSQKPLVLDSPDPAVLKAVCSKAGPGVLLNSITLEPKRFAALRDLAVTTGAGLIALLMPADHLPKGVDERLTAADTLIQELGKSGIEPQRIFLDPMIRPIATGTDAGIEALKSIQALKKAFPEAHVVIGLSNISYGLPARRYINRAFFIQSMAMGLDSAIVNTLDPELVALYRAGRALLGQDEFCMDYVTHYRPKRDGNTD
jgi:5-methyltetrahydrofolate--homocysteine methyltransferase